MKTVNQKSYLKSTEDATVVKKIFLDFISGKKYNLKYNDLFPLKKFLKCPHCNSNLTGSFSTERHNKKYPYYHCVTKGCPYKTVRTDYAEHLFLNYLKSFEMDKEFINKLFDDAKEFLNRKQQDNKNIVAYLKKEITHLEEQRAASEDLH